MPLRHGPLPPRTVHLCVDMQNLLGPESPWHAPWSHRILPAVTALVERAPAATVFTRFVPPPSMEGLPAGWRRFYERWAELRRGRADPWLFELMAPLDRFVPPALVLDKPVLSPFSGRRLPGLLRARRTEAVLVSGAETDICVLATVLGAIDRGLRVVLAADALCGSRDMTHDAVLTFYRERLWQQIEVADTADIVESWAAARER